VPGPPRSGTARLITDPHALSIPPNITAAQTRGFA
jgi:hypothetical protein